MKKGLPEERLKSSVETARSGAYPWQLRHSREREKNTKGGVQVYKKVCTNWNHVLHGLS